MSQKKKSNISFGPGASSLILIFVVLTMSVLGMLALMNGRNDARLSDRSAQVIQAVYTLNGQAEERRAQLDALMKQTAETARTNEEYMEAIEAALPADVYLEEEALCWTESDGYRMLDCALTVQPLGSEERTAWLRHNLTAETEEVW